MIDLPDYNQIIDNGPTTEVIFIDDDLFSDEDIQDGSKQIIDDIFKDINQSEILMEYELTNATTTTTTTTTTTAIKQDPKSLNFKDVLLSKRKQKKSSLLAASEAIRKKYKKVRQEENNQLKFIK